MSSQGAAAGPASALLRQWRTRRRVSQQELSSQTGISTRHLSFLETGRARPSRQMALRLAEHLELPLRDRNELLVAAGHAPQYSHTPLSAESMRDVRRALQGLIDAHQPCPAMAVDPVWNLVLANDAALSLADGMPEDLLTDPINVMRLLLHPSGLRSRMPDFPAYSAHLLNRLQRQYRATAQPAVGALLRECQDYPGVTQPGSVELPVAPVLRLRLTPDGPTLSFFTVVSTLGTPYDVTLDEIVIESFFPADAATAEAIGMRTASAPAGSSGR